MPTRDHVPAGAPVWIDLSTSDPVAAMDFYPALFGWTVQQLGPDFGNYVNFLKDGELIAGMIKNPQPGMPDAWTTYLSSSDATATADAVRAAGGQVLLDPMAVMGLGTMAVVSDPGGATVGVWQPGTHRGFGLVAEAGAPAWHELHSRDYSSAVTFYEKAFGWNTSAMRDTDDVRYCVLVPEGGGGMYAGIMDAESLLPVGAPDDWQVYLGVVDVDAALARVTQLGGSVTQPAADGPFGRLAQAADSTGALFKLTSLPG